MNILDIIRNSRFGYKILILKKLEYRINSLTCKEKTKFLKLFDNIFNKDFLSYKEYQTFYSDYCPLGIKQHKYLIYYFLIDYFKCKNENQKQQLRTLSKYFKTTMLGFDFNRVKYLVEKRISHTKLFEMALTRDKFISIVEALSDQIFQNYVLISWASKKIAKSECGHQTININHWKTELKGLLLKLSRTQIKKQSNNGKAKTIIQYWINERELTKRTDNDIRFAVERKRLKEHIAYDNDWEASIDDCKNALKNIANLVSYNDEHEIFVYVDYIK